MNREPHTPAEFVEALHDARKRSLALIEDLDDEQWFGPQLEIVNPPIWEFGHVAWFQEKWCARHPRGCGSLEPEADILYDSAAIAHDTRWRLRFPNRAKTMEFAACVLKGIEGALLSAVGLSAEDRALHHLALFHEDMHAEAFVYSRQTLAYAAPACSAPHEPGGGALTGDASIAGGAFSLGAEKGHGFCFDNEQWAHTVEVAPFRMARAPVTQLEFLRFVEDAGYRRPELWSADGWAWREREDALHPVYWRRSPGGDWSRRRYDEWVPLEDHLPVHFVNAYEAEAYCRWAHRRLPSEAEWEAAVGPARFPWGDEPPTSGHAQLDLLADEPCEVGAHPKGDSPDGLRQMIGNVWEWTSSVFGPYPGFTPGIYAEYSQPWFGDQRVLRGGAFATRARMLRKTCRNFYRPDRRDVLTGFRTCGL